MEKTPTKNGGPVTFIVSNRLPVTVKQTGDGKYEASSSSGGLVGAIQALFDTEFIWYGWPGQEILEQDRGEVKRQLAEKKAIPVFLGKDLADKHYNGFSNKILWPLLHYQMHEIHMSKPDWEAYQEVNRVFARALIPELHDGDTVWVQDYHLFLLPSYLRQELESSNKKVKIGFFLHTVFPSSDFFRILPVRRQILAGLLSCDLIGFHNRDYTDHFFQCCRKIMGLETRQSQVLFQGRAINVLTHPIGIDPTELRNILSEPTALERLSAFNEKYQDVQLIISVDRLDYIKGIPLRIAAIEALLTKHPEHVGNVVFLQVVIPSREGVEGYQILHNQIDEMVSRVNGKHGDIGTTTIQALFSPVTKSELAALYAASDVCIVSSTRDGMNIVSLEYVACQQERHGVLVLSEFAGASEVLGESVKINPWDEDEFAEAIHYALTMEMGERKLRWERLWEWVSANTAKRWGEAFLEALGKVVV